MRRLFLLLLVVLIATVCVLALRLLCVVFAGLLVGVFLFRTSHLVERHTPLSYRSGFALISSTLILLGVGTGLLVAPQIGLQLSDLSSTVSSSAQDLLKWLNQQGWIQEATTETPEIGTRLLSSLDATSFLGGVFSSISGSVGAVFLIAFVGFFLALDPQTYRRGFLLLVPPLNRERADELLKKSIDTLWWWTLGRLVAMTIVGVATSIGLFLLGMPLALTLGMLAGLVSFVPTVGAVLAIIPALLVAFQQGTYAPFYVLVLYLGVQAIENNLITPFVQERAVSIPPVILIVSQVLMGLLVGIVGVMIATPLAALVMCLVQQVYVQEEADGVVGAGE